MEISFEDLKSLYILILIRETTESFYLAFYYNRKRYLYAQGGARKAPPCSLYQLF